MFERIVKLLIVFALFITAMAPWAVVADTVCTATQFTCSGGIATAVSAAAYPLLAPAGSKAAPSYSFSGATNRGMYGASGLFFASSGQAVAQFDANNEYIASDGQYAWTSGTEADSGSVDTGIARAAAGVAKATLGGANDGWIQNSQGDQFLTANATNATATPANLTDLTTNVTNGRKYVFTFIAQVDNSTDTDGIRFDFDGGNATATDFRVTCKSFNNNLTTNVSTTTALATDITEASYVGVGTFECAGSFEPSSTGTFIPRFATNTAVSGTLTVFRGSSLLVNDMP